MEAATQPPLFYEKYRIKLVGLFFLVAYAPILQFFLLPIILFEVFLSVWLMVEGFMLKLFPQNPSSNDYPCRPFSDYLSPVY